MGLHGVTITTINTVKWTIRIETLANNNNQIVHSHKGNLLYNQKYWQVLNSAVWLYYKNIGRTKFGCSVRDHYNNIMQEYEMLVDFHLAVEARPPKSQIFWLYGKAKLIRAH